MDYRFPNNAFFAMNARIITYLLSVILLALTYFVSGKLGLLLAVPPGYATAIFPPSGIALATLLLWGNRLWPGILIGWFSMNLTLLLQDLTVNSLGALFTGSFGAVAQAVFGAFLFRRWVGFGKTLDNSVDVAKFILLVGPIGCLVSATWGTTVLFSAGLLAPEEQMFSWWTWWVGDTMGVLIVTPMVMIFFGQPRGEWRHRIVSVALPLSISFVAMTILFFHASASETERTTLDFQQKTRRVGSVLWVYLDRSLEVVYSIESHFKSVRQVGRDDFSNFVHHALERNPGIQALSWNARVVDAQRDNFEQSMQDNNHPQFQITERNADSRMVRAARRSEYVAVTFIEPMLGNENALGFDVGSNPIRLAALNQARDSGKPVATGRITLVQEAQSQFGILVLLPLYKTGQIPKTSTERRRFLIGYAVGVFRLGDIVRTALRDSGIDSENIVFGLFDNSASSEARELAIYPLSEGVSFANISDTHSGNYLLHRLIYQFGGRDWTLMALATPRYFEANRRWSSWAVLVGGLLFTSLLGGFLLVLTGHAKRDGKRVVELAKANSTLGVCRSCR